MSNFDSLVTPANSYLFTKPNTICQNRRLKNEISFKLCLEVWRRRIKCKLLPSLEILRLCPMRIWIAFCNKSSQFNPLKNQTKRVTAKLYSPEKLLRELDITAPDEIDIEAIAEYCQVIIIPQKLKKLLFKPLRNFVQSFGLASPRLLFALSSSVRFRQLSFSTASKVAVGDFAAQMCLMRFSFVICRVHTRMLLIYCMEKLPPHSLYYSIHEDSIKVTDTRFCLFYGGRMNANCLIWKMKNKSPII